MQKQKNTDRVWELLFLNTDALRQRASRIYPLDHKITLTQLRIMSCLAAKKGRQC